jgi:hypothetical protein
LQQKERHNLGNSVPPTHNDRGLIQIGPLEGVGWGVFVIMIKYYIGDLLVSLPPLHIFIFLFARAH